MLNFINRQENANQNQMRYHFTPIRMTIIKKKEKKEGRKKRGREKQVTSDGEEVEKLEQLCLAGRTLKGNTIVENRMSVPQNTKPRWSSNSTLRYVLKIIESKDANRCSNTNHSRIFHDSQKVKTIQSR